LTLARVLLATVYMTAPGAAHLLTRAVRREGWTDLFLRPNLRRVWPYQLATWIGPAVVTLVGVSQYFVPFRQHFDAELGVIRALAERAGGSAGAAVAPSLVLVAQGLSTVLLSPILNGIPALGEEYGWWPYLQPKLLVLVGPRRALILRGVTWGVWHWPITAMGHNYGLGYAGAPWAGMLAMV
jgi:membrane protease YdiL (CAAX protease family)